MLPLGAGSAVGFLVASGIRACRPALAYDSREDSFWSVALLLLMVLELVYVALVLTATCWLSHTRVTTVSWKRAALVGMTLSISGIGYAGFVQTACTIAHWSWFSDAICILVIALATILFTAITPFVLLMGDTDSGPARRFPKFALAGMVLIPLAGFASVVVQQWNYVITLDQKLQNITAWVSANHPTPGSYPALPLPAAFQSLSENGTADAVITHDGCVILILKTELAWHGNWSGIIYSSRPIFPAEFGKEYTAEGRPAIRIEGLADHFIVKQIDNQHFRAACDLG
jgi:hypothetical protein